MSEILGPGFLHPSREINDSRGDLTRASGETISVSVSTAVPRDRRNNPVGIAYQIVNGHGGIITVDSSPGYGSTFSVHIPVG